MKPDASAYTIFNAALEELDPAARTAYVKEACGEDVALRERVEKLLQAHDEAGGFFSQPLATTPVQPGPASLSCSMEKAGDAIGRYKLLEQIGEGGCGVVYMAEQQEPVRRRVALKVIKLGMDTKQVVARFEAERQALALMDHPNIARVLDAGATDTGRPYFVMELVRGIKITEFCDQKRLSTQERLELFISVCRAVQHAHQKGIIHRDLKPSNLLVTIVDGAPVPKVIDFGIAKATSNQPLTDKTLFTAFAQFVGMPAYMSPEQAEMSGVDIDTRTDIYSLGVVLYELLTGKTPFDAEALLRAGIDEIRRTIREQEPPKPSTRLHSLSQADLTTTARARHVDGHKLIQTVKGDLDWIVMKCLEKERGRRYETVNGLAADILRHLNTEPVVARPPSRWYEFQKTIRRHKVGFAAAAAIASALLLGIVASTWQAIRATRAEREQSRLREGAQQAEAKQVQLREQADEARARAQANEQKAETEAARSEQVARFMKDMLRGVGPSVALGRDTALLREILDQTAQRLDELKNQPAVEADLRHTLGVVYWNLSDYDHAEAMLQRALTIQKELYGEKDLRVAATLHQLGQLHHRTGKETEAEANYRRALAIQEERAGHESLAVAATLNGLGTCLRSQGKSEEAVAKLRDGLGLRRRLLPPDHTDVAGAMSDLGVALNSLRKYQEAEQYHREALALHKKNLPPVHPYIAYAEQQLADSLTGQGKDAEAETNYLAALAIQRKVLGDHRDTAITLEKLGTLLLKENRLPEAEQRIREALAMRNKVFGESAGAAELLGKLADQFKRAKRYREGEKAAQEALDIQTALHGSESIEVASAAKRLAGLLWDQGKENEAEQHYSKALQLQRQHLGNENREVASTLLSFGYLLSGHPGSRREAEALLRESSAIGTKLRDHRSQILAMTRLSWAITNQTESLQLLREALEMSKKEYGKDDPKTAEQVGYLSDCLLKQGPAGEAEKLLREALADAEKRDAANGIKLAYQYRLGDFLSAQKRFGEAEPLLASAYSELQRRSAGFAKIAEIPSVRRRLMELYCATGQREKAAPLIRAIAKSESPSTLNGLAWTFASAANPALRDGSNALIYAEMAVAGTSRTNGVILDSLAAAYAELGQFDKAIPIQQEAISLLTNTQEKAEYTRRLLLYQSGMPYHNHGELASQALALIEAGKFAEAEPLARECVALREKMMPDDWLTFNARSILGGSLLRQKKYSEAEPLLLSGYEGMKQREDKIPAAGKPRVKETLQRLVQLYEETNRPDQAAEWKQKLAELAGRQK